MVHNHPSGSLKPSEHDLDITNRMIQAGIIMGVNILDHVTVTPNSYDSFQEQGVMEKLWWDKKYALTFVREKQVAQEIAALKKTAEKSK